MLSGILFFLLLILGFHLAQRKPIWNDEIMTQTHSIDRLSYGQILRGLTRVEGNNHPLFYLIQKIISDLNHYRFPKAWEGEYLYAEPRSQLTMRIGSNIFMSLSLVILFYFFSLRYSLGVGLYALLIALLAPMTWIYWVEARPYSLWFLLSVLQSLLLVQLFAKVRAEAMIFTGLSVIHVLLAVTTMASALQIIIASFVVWFLFKDKPWRVYGGLTVLPLALCVFYYIQSTKFLLAMPSAWGKLIYPHLSQDQMTFLSVYVTFLLCHNLKNRRSWSSFFYEDKQWEAKTYLMFVLLMLAGTMGYFIAQGSVPIPNPHNMIKDKYFLYLTPVVIVATILFSIDLVKNCRNDPWMSVNIILGLMGFVVIRFLRAYLEISHANLILNYLGEYW